MVSSQNPEQHFRRGPDTLPALRDLLIQDPRIGKVEACPDGHSSLDRHDDKAPKEIHHAPSIAPATPATELSPQLVSLRSDGISTDKPSVGRGAFHTIAPGFVVIAIVGAALALFAFESDQKKNIVTAWDLSRSWVSSVLRPNLSQGSNAAAKPVSKPLDQMPTRNSAVLPAAPGISSAPASVATGSAPELQHQLEAMANDLAAVRRLMDQLTARQDQMARDIATLQGAEQNVSPKISPLPQSPTVHTPRKRVGRMMYKVPLAADPNRPRTDPPVD